MEYCQPLVVLYAKWDAIEYNIEYVENGGNELSNEYYTVEHAFALNHNIYKSGYVFIGWYNNPQFDGNKIDILEAGSIGNKIYYAKWVKDNFTISLDVNYTYTDGIPAIIDGYEYNIYYNQNFILPVPINVGYVFIGWFIGDKKITNELGLSLDVYLEEDDVEAIAMWSRETYFIKINTNGSFKWLTKEGENFIFSNNEQSVEYVSGLCPNCYIMSQIAKGGQYAKSMQNYLFKEGHIYLNMIKDINDPTTLACWQGVAFAEQFNDGSLINIYANYKVEKNFKIYYKQDNSIYGQFTGDYGSDIQAVMPKNIKGYSFDYFEVDDCEENMQYRDTQFAIGERFNYNQLPDLTVNIEADNAVIYLIPIYKANRYTVSFKNTLENFDDMEVIYDNPYTFSNAFPVPNKIGYEFCGWYDTSYYWGTPIVDNTGNIDKWNMDYDCILYAKWELIIYDITYNTNGGEIESDDMIFEYSVKSPTFQLFSVYKHGTNHIGWEILGKRYNYESSVTIDNDSLGDIIVTAIYEDDTVIMNSSGRLYRTNTSSRYRCIEVDLTNAFSDIIIQINSGIRNVVFKNDGHEIKNIYIEINSDRIIDIDLINCNFIGRSFSKTAKGNGTIDNLAYVLNTVSTFHVNINIFGNNIIKQAEFTTNEGNMLSGAFITRNATVYALDSAAILNIYAGDGKGNQGMDGIDAGSAWLAGIGGDGSTQIYVNCDINIYAGDGSNGKNGASGDINQAGGNGGRGGSCGFGLFLTGTLNVEGNYILVGSAGKPGAGGKGGNGGDGQNAVWFGQSSLAGANGGNGGNGGATCSPIAYTKLYGQIINPPALAGTGGKGGSGGIGGKPLVGDRRPSGSNGNDGISYS